MSAVDPRGGGTRRPPEEARARVRSLRSRVDAALQRGLAKRLGVARLELREGHHLQGIGEGRRGRLVISFFPIADRDRAARAVAASALLHAAGVPVPGVLDADLAGDCDAGLAWVAMPFVEGDEPARSDPAMRRAAMQTLAGVHAIERNRVLAAGRPEARELPVYRGFDAFEEEAEAVALELGEAGVAPSADEVARIASFLRARVAAMRSYRPALPLVLLHTDFQPANLLRSPDGRLLVVDLEGASFGAFAFDLARALFKFRFRVKDAELDALRVAQVLGDRGIAGLCGDYFEAAGGASAQFWSQHGATVLFYGYLKMIRRRAKFAQNPRRGGWLRRRRSAAQAAQRWASALAWVDGAS